MPVNSAMFENLSSEIRDILMSEWRLNPATARELSTQSAFLAGRRKYHYRKALGLTDESTPRLMHAMPSETWFDSDADTLSHLREQLSYYDYDPAQKPCKPKHRASYLFETDLRFRFARVFDGLLDQVAA